MGRLNPYVLAHLEWLGFVQPTGLVVSATALVRAGAVLDRRDVEGQQLLRECTDERAFTPDAPPERYLPDFRAFAASVLGWSFSTRYYAGTDDAPIPPELEMFLSDYGETLRPDFAVREREPKDNASPWQLLVSVVDPEQEFDRVLRGAGHFEASPHARMERLLRHTGVAAGLLFNGRALRLVSAPSGESSGWLDFRVADMLTAPGRPIGSALRLLLTQTRLLGGQRSQRLVALLEDSRKFQNEVSERLAEQVLHGLYELLRGLQAAHDTSDGELLRGPLADDPDQVYRAMLTVVLRLVFLLYAEERDMLPGDETFLRSYSLAGLYERLREDAALYPDTMEQRFGAWAQLLVLFRLIYDGAEAGGMRLPRRRGVLFDPDRFPFLEGRAVATKYSPGERLVVPLVPDGTIYRALENLLVLDGERISYRALDVEQIGSVYETMMGFRLELATGRSLALKSKKKQGAPTAVDLDALLEQPVAQRKSWLEERSGRDFTDRVTREVRAAATIDDLHAALASAIDRQATPDHVPAGAMVLQPSEERRKSGSHYTPRALTEPIVETTLAPILQRLRAGAGGPPRPEAILELKVCDPAMGSGAFLVEACRQLGKELIESWHAHHCVPRIPPDEDELVYARRLVAQRCLYGVDRNPVAVDLAKVSLWLTTLAKDHALTFVDHALRHGDSLVGLTCKQVEAFHWDADAPGFEDGFETMRAREHIERVTQLRDRIRDAGDAVDDAAQRALWEEAQVELGQVCVFGDLVIAAYFGGSNAREREARRHEHATAAANNQGDRYRSRIDALRQAQHPLVPFHWELEFPEVFGRDDAGFDAIVGNPPFAGKNTMASGNAEYYPEWLRQLHEGSHGNSDLVAHFFRRSFELLCPRGAFGLIATNTIGQGDTRATGLRWICNHGGEIYAARRRVKWPGLAAVIVSVVHVSKGPVVIPPQLDGRSVDRITAFLFHRGGHDDPARLVANAGKSFQGSIVLGMGFTFDDTDPRGIATPLSEMRRLLEKDPRNAERIFPYIGGEEVNTSPTHAHHRYVINFGEMSESEARQWPDLMAIVEAKVKPERMRINREIRKRNWWRFAETTPALFAAISGLGRVLVISRVGQHGSLTFLMAGAVCSESLIVFPLPTFAAFCALQSRPHEIWARFFGSSLEDRLRYTPSDCFETFPFPANWETHRALAVIGESYYGFRAALMIGRDEGMTQTYNRFHDPHEREADILKLRELHVAMDRAVLDAYGWSDVSTDCEFLLDYEIDEEEWSPRRRKPWRYRWPDDVRDEVLARLLELNRTRAAEEARTGPATDKKKLSRKAGGRSTEDTKTRDLFS